MCFGTISGNTFYHMASGSASSNQIILQCYSTAMTGNRFTGYKHYIDGKNSAHVITNNAISGDDDYLSTINMSSSSIIKDNLAW